MKKKQLTASILLAMKITIVQITLAVVFTCSVYAHKAIGQTVINQAVTISAENIKIRKLIASIQQQTGVRFLYSPSAIKSDRKINFAVNAKPLGIIMDEIFRPLGIGYKIINDQVLLYSLEDARKERDAGNEPAETREQPERLVTGVVANEQGEPLTGVSITIKESLTGTTTDSKGTFKINVPDDNTTLVISYVGYQSQEVMVGVQSTLTIKLLSGNGGRLDSIVVIGYGTQKKTDVTGSVASVPKDRLSKVPVTNILQALEGSVAGYTLTQVSTVPGSSANQQIRGINSINASTTPLIILDGVPFPGMTNDISPNTIESIEVLKDASATAIYGTRGSSGVILITTKRGASGKPVIGYSGGLPGPEYAAHTMESRMNAAEYKAKNVAWNQKLVRVNLNPYNDYVPNSYEVTN